MGGVIDAEGVGEFVSAAVGEGCRSSSSRCAQAGSVLRPRRSWVSQETRRWTAVSMSPASLTRWKRSTLTLALGSQERTADRNAALGSIATTWTRCRHQRGLVFNHAFTRGRVPTIDDADDLAAGQISEGALHKREWVRGLNPPVSRSDLIR